MTRNDPIYVHSIACKGDAWLKSIVEKEAARKGITTSEYVRWVLEAFHRSSFVQNSSNLVYEASAREKGER